MLLYLASELRLFKQSAVIGRNFKVKAYKKDGKEKLNTCNIFLAFILLKGFSLSVNAISVMF